MIYKVPWESCMNTCHCYGFKMSFNTRINPFLHVQCLYFSDQIIHLTWKQVYEYVSVFVYRIGCLLDIDLLAKFLSWFWLMHDLSRGELFFSYFTPYSTSNAFHWPLQLPFASTAFTHNQRWSSCCYLFQHSEQQLKDWEGTLFTNPAPWTGHSFQPAQSIQYVLLFRCIIHQKLISNKHLAFGHQTAGTVTD